VKRRWRQVAIVTGILALWLLLNTLGVGAPETRSASGAAVIVRDGDTMSIGGLDHRLHGIDAPEYAQTCTDAIGALVPCGKLARAALAGLAKGHTITCTARARDRYKRIVATCTDERGRDLAAAMAEAGMAASLNGFAPGPYADAVAAARAARRGFWAGRFDPPAGWRAAHSNRESFAVDSLFDWR
jgi:endonuclease YncB( thermonuclease family)